MKSDVYKTPSSNLDDSKSTTSKVVNIADARKYFLSSSLLLVMNFLMAGAAYISNGAGNPSLIKVILIVWFSVLFMYSVSASIFATQLGKRGLLWFLMILSFQPISLFVSYIIIFRQGYKHNWFRSW